MPSIGNTKMKRSTLMALLLTACATIALAAPAARWLFTDKEEMEQTVTVHADNPRAAYYIILHASKQGLAAQTAVAYHDLLQKTPRDPYLQSTYAFSHFMATGPFSRQYFTGKPSDAEKELWKQQGKSLYYRNEAIKAKPDSPVVLLETALFLFYSDNESTKAVEYLRKAAELAPDWADTHYWLGKALSDYWASPIVSKEKQGDIASETITSLDRALKLEPKLRDDCLTSYTSAYQALNQPDKALAFLDDYYKSHPDFAKRPENVAWHKWLEDEAKKKGLLKDKSQVEKTK